MAISIPAQSRALPPLDGDHRWWVLKSAARCTKGVETKSKKKLLITTNSNSKSRLASSYSSQLRKSSGTRNARRKKSQQAWFPEGAASGRPILQDPKVKQLSIDSRPCRVPNNRLLRFAGLAASLFCPGEARGVFAVWWWWWWYYPTPSEGWGHGGTPRRPNSRATPQGLDHRSRIEREEPKIDLRRGSEAGQSRRR